MGQTTRQRILVAATELWCELSYHKVSTRLIAQKAGCAHSLLHRHWASKEALFTDVLIDARSAFFEKAAGRIRADDSLPMTFTKTLYARNEKIFILLRHFLGNDEFPGVLEKYLEGSPFPLDNLPHRSLENAPEIDRDSLLMILVVALTVPAERLLTPYIGKSRAQRAHDNCLHALIRMTYSIK